MEAPQPKPPKEADPYSAFSFKKPIHLQFSSSAPFTPTYLNSNLSLSSDPALAYATRVKGKHSQLDNPATSTMSESRAKQEQKIKERKEKDKARKAARGGLGARPKRPRFVREKGLWRLNESQAKFQLFLPIHHLWMGYMSEVLGLAQSPPAGTPVNDAVAKKAMPNSAAVHPKLVKADFHGSIMTIRQSKNPCLVGISGIVFHETENAFKIVTKDDKIKLLPKQNSIFSFAVPLFSTLPPSYDPSTPYPVPPAEEGQALKTVLDGPHIEFELHGNQFRFRAADRAGRKFKAKESIEL